MAALISGGREIGKIGKIGHAVRLIPPACVKPFVKCSIPDDCAVI